MSVSIDHYAIKGVILDYDKVNSLCEDNFEVLEKYMDKNECFGCVYDGMSGEYIILGDIVEKANQGDYLDEPVSIEISNDDKEKILPKIKEVMRLLNFNQEDITNTKLYAVFISHHH